jgi:hypothetical protein
VTGAAETIAAAQSAWARIERGATFEDWLVVARALAIGRERAMTAAKVNRPFGRIYAAAIGAWLREHGLDKIAPQERHSALRMLDQIEAIEQWRAGIDPAIRRRLNHPNSIWWRWKRATGRMSTREASARWGRVPLGLDQAQLARASDAVYELLKRGCTDAMVVARAALLAATRAPAARPARPPATGTDHVAAL